MQDFKDWWNAAEIFCGEGGMEAAEAAWDYQEEIIRATKAEVEALERMHSPEDSSDRLGRLGSKLFGDKWINT